MCEICDKTFKKIYKKLRNHLFKMKELNEIVLGKGLFAFIQGVTLYDKRTLG